MSSSKKLLQAAAGSAGGAGLNIEDVFSTYLYEGNGSTQTITNGIDLSGEGGLVWIKERGLTRNHHLVDTERGIGDGIRALRTNLTSAEYYQSGYDAYEVTSANSNGFSVGLNLTNETNRSGSDYASWTFRKAPKFFDVVTYTGTGSATTISHNLGSVPGCIIVKRTDSTENWKVYHRAIHPTNNGSGYVINLNLTNARAATTIWSSTEPTSTEFSISGSSTVNASGGTYVAYLFAHNDGDGEFGPTADQDVIKCGSYTGNGSTNGPEINLGWEPQWLLIKRTDSATPWVLIDDMRGLLVEGTGSSGRPSVQYLQPNDSAAELNNNYLAPKSTGFKLGDSASYVNASGGTYIYIAIRRGPMAVPESATDVFAMDTLGGTLPNPPAFNSDFTVDAGLYRLKNSSSSWLLSARLTQGRRLATDSTASEAAESGQTFDYMNGYYNSTGVNSNYQSWMWKRAPNFFDVVAYTGNGTAGRTVSHNLGVAPEMMWVKRRNTTGEWAVYHSGVDASAPQDYYTLLGATNAKAASTAIWNDTAPTADVFSLGTIGWVNASSDNYIAYLFASVDGVSKVFSVTKSSGSDASVNCGFSAGPRFVLLKRTDSTGDWYVWDSERGIVAGNDPYLLLNSTAAEVTSTDYIDPTSNGFTIVNGGLADGDYIGYAVA